ncbi:hypothetical protein U1Q18_019872 [Sarracenia purpurea var. burkii]
MGGVAKVNGDERLASKQSRCGARSASRRSRAAQGARGAHLLRARRFRQYFPKCANRNPNMGDFRRNELLIAGDRRERRRPCLVAEAKRREGIR